uniref:DUF38 domain-containing protein n=1 Tax=Panagrellus redivivus TaxID=6233 RepID=A0A7E4V4M6_PANRE
MAFGTKVAPCTCNDALWLPRQLLHNLSFNSFAIPSVQGLPQDDVGFVTMRTVRRATLDSPNLIELYQREIRKKECVYILPHFLFLNIPHVGFGIENCYVWSAKTPETEHEFTETLMNVESIKLVALGTKETYSCLQYNWVRHQLNKIRSYFEMPWIRTLLNNRRAPVKIDATEVGTPYVMKILECQCVTELDLYKFKPKLFDAFHRQTHIRKVGLRYNKDFNNLPAVPEIHLNAARAKGLDIKKLQPLIPPTVTKFKLSLKYREPTADNLETLIGFLDMKVKNVEIEVLCHYSKNPCGIDVRNKMVETLASLYDFLVEALEEAPSEERRLSIIFEWRHLPFPDLKDFIPKTLNNRNIPCVITNRGINKYDFRILMEEREHCEVCVSLVIPEVIRKPFCFKWSM